MEDVILCVLASCGVAMILWCMTGWALLPQRGRQVTILYASGDAMALEQRVRAQRWLRQSGLTGGRIILADCGLTAEARGLADYLAEREDNAAVVDGADFRLDAGNER